MCICITAVIVVVYVCVRVFLSHDQVQLTETEIRQLCHASREIFASQPCLLELEAPIKICGR